MGKYLNADPIYHFQDDSVRSHDVELHILQHRIEAAKSAEEQAMLKGKLLEEIQVCLLITYADLVNRCLFI